MYLELLDAETRNRGLSLESEGVNEVCWEKSDALRVVSVASQAGLPILGGDVWRHESDGRWRPTGDNWFSEPHQAEHARAFAERALSEATAFLERYPDPGNGTRRYVIVFGKRSDSN
jgi:hypothetical protein